VGEGAEESGGAGHLVAHALDSIFLNLVEQLHAGDKRCDERHEEHHEHSTKVQTTTKYPLICHCKLSKG
jgi:hypothetical protein